MRFKFTDTEIKKLIKNIVVIVDTNEKENSWIIDYFIKHRVKYKVQKLQQGDYSGFIKYNEETKKILESAGIHRDLYFTNDILIERKAHLDELAGNLSTKKEKVENGKVVRTEVRERERFRFELTRIQNSRAKLFLFIEDPQGDRNIRMGNYRSNYEPKSFLASLKSFEAEFDFTYKFMDRAVIGSEIYNTVYYHIRDILKKGSIEKLKEEA